MGVEIIAEIGINHDGDLQKAFDLIDAAAEAGADVIKFQASEPRLETSARHAPEHLAMIEKYILDRHALALCHQRCFERGIEFLCTPAEEDSLAWLLEKNLIKRIKVSSDNLTNIPFLRAVGDAELPIILSTGMASLDMIFDAWGALCNRGLPKNITILHCTSSYPCAPEDANLAAIPELRRIFRRAAGIGWSDHTLSWTLPAVAVGLGVAMIEKHITRGGDGPDHKASLNPAEFGEMVQRVREAEKALGEAARLGVLNCELETERVARKSVVAATAISQGEPFTVKNLAVKRPGTGLLPATIDLL